MEKIIRSKRVVSPMVIGPASIHMRDGRITAVRDWDDVPAEIPLHDAGNLVVMPGNVDAHVHVNEPGRTEWEGFETATRAAGAGGITTIVDMPLNSIPPTTTLPGFEEKLGVAKGKCSVDVAFWGGVVPGNVSELAPMVARGVRGFKCFLIHSGVDEFPHITEPDLHVAMGEIAKLGSVLLVHAEMPGPIDAAAVGVEERNPRTYQTFLKSRPPAAENEAIALMIELCRATQCPVHIVHLSSAEALPMLRKAKAEGLPVTVETCPHYLTFAAEDIPDGATHFKCCPPVRERDNRESLWAAVADGTIDMVVSDHSPCTPALKLQETGNFLEAWGGIAALQFGLPVMWTNLRSRGFGIQDLTRLMARATAELAGLQKQKGLIAAGFDADLVVWDPEATFEVTAETILHRHKLTPYAGMQLYGSIDSTYLRGRKVYGSGSESFRHSGTTLL